MLSSSELYRVWRKRLAELSPDGCLRMDASKSRLMTMVMVVVGLFKAQSVHLTLVARKLPIRAKKLSLINACGGCWITELFGFGNGIVR